MNALNMSINLFAYAAFSFAALLVWPSRRNVIALGAIPFFVVGYIIPLATVDYRYVASDQVVDRLSLINALGAIGMLLGVVVSSIVKTGRPIRAAASGSLPLSDDDRVRRAMLLSCTIMTLCFAWMGVLPIFAEEPFLAKFFKGPYKERYDQVAAFYRFAQAVLGIALPLALAGLTQARSRQSIFLVLWAVTLFAVSLNRGTVLAGALLVLAAWCSRSQGKMFMYVATATVIYAVGSSLYAIVGIFAASDIDIWAAIASGAPDVADHLTFIAAFDANTQLSHGLTFVGGLVPGNFYFNPSVFSLAIINDTSDISEISSGGLRLPPSVAGYMAFGWVGALFVPFASGWLTGHFTKRLKRMKPKSLKDQVVCLIWYQFCAGFLIGFYMMSYSNLVSLALFTLLVKWREPRSRRLSKPGESDPGALVVTYPPTAT